MRTKLVVWAAVAVLGLCPRLVSSARAAPKGKASAKAAASKAQETKRPTELHADDKSMKKQLQWEDKVMGPDSTRADLARIARAHALNEKAIKDKELQAAREAAAPPPPVIAPPKTSKRADVALPSVNDGARSDDNVPSRGISPKLATDEAKATPAPAARPADDKFIDKLLREESDAGASRRKGHSGSDRDLDKLLATASEKSTGRGGDAVDKLIKKADSGPAMPAPRVQSQPAWISQPDLPSTPAVTASAPTPTPTPARPATRRNDGVIRVVQGSAASNPEEEPTPATTARASSSRGASRRSETSARPPTTWNDPFADSPVATRERVSSGSSAPRKATASRASVAPSEWNDPFADKPGEGKSTRRTSAPSTSAPSSSPKREKSEPSGHPSGGSGWKDPFTKAPSDPARNAVAMREVGKLEGARWEAAPHRSATPRATSEAPRGWALLKKRSR